jgi:hypothetical protein
MIRMRGSFLPAGRDAKATEIWGWGCSKTSLGHCALDSDPERCDETGLASRNSRQTNGPAHFGLYCFAHLTAFNSERHPKSSDAGYDLRAALRAAWPAHESRR